MGVLLFLLCLLGSVFWSDRTFIIPEKALSRVRKRMWEGVGVTIMKDKELKLEDKYLKNRNLWEKEVGRPVTIGGSTFLILTSHICWCKLDQCNIGLRFCLFVYYKARSAEKICCSSPFFMLVLFFLPKKHYRLIIVKHHCTVAKILKSRACVLHTCLWWWTVAYWQENTNPVLFSYSVTTDFFVHLHGKGRKDDEMEETSRGTSLSTPKLGPLSETPIRGTPSTLGWTVISYWQHGCSLLQKRPTLPDWS